MRLLYWGGALTILLLISPASFADFDPGECLATKPKIESYETYDAFIVEIIRYKKVQRFCATLPPELIAPEPEVTEEPPLNSQLIEINEKTGLEDMNTAVSNARSYSHIPHSERLKYDKTTPESIPLSKINNGEMKTWDVKDGFGDPSAGEPITYDEMSDIAVDTDRNSVAFHSSTSETQRSGSYVMPSYEHVTSLSQDQNGFTDAHGNRVLMRQDGGRDNLIIHDVQIGN